MPDLVQTPPTPSATTEATARANLRKAEADAATAETASRVAAVKAAIGEVPPSGYSGALVANDGAALAEANIMVRRDLHEVAKTIRDRIQGVVAGRNVYLSASDTPPDCTGATTYAVHVALVRKSLADAIGLSGRIWPAGNPAEAPVVKPMLVGALTGAGLVLSGVNSLISYAKLDYVVAGKDLQLAQRPLQLALAGLLAAGCNLRLEGAKAMPDEAIRGRLTEELAELSQDASDARRRAAYHEAELKRLTPPPPLLIPGVPPPPPVDPDPGGEAPGHGQALAALTAAVAMFDGLVAALLAVTDGAIALQRIAEERALLAFLSAPDAVFVSVRMDGAFSSTVSKRGMFAGLGQGIPYSIRTVLTASWKCEEVATGKVTSAGVEHHHGKLQRLDDVH